MVTIMVYTKKIKSIATSILYLYLVSFPFGQLLRYQIESLAFHLADIFMGVFVFFGSIYLVLAKTKFPRPLLILTGVLAFSQIVSLRIFSFGEVGAGLLYLFRFFVYLLSGFITYRIALKNKPFSRLLVSSLLVVGAFIAIFGWIQYFTYPDLRSLFWLGWDDHYLRLVGAYLDPAFTSILLVLGFLLSVYALMSYQDFNFDKKYLMLLSGFLLFTLLFTYSRSGYLALIMGVLILFVRKLARRLLAVLFLLFVVSLILLPRGDSEGVKLERIASIEGRLGSYAQGLEIIRRYPVFGVGFNNLCLAKINLGFEEYGSPLSHSCSGLDNVFLMILSTTGVIGTLVFLYTGSSLLKIAYHAPHGRVFIASLVSVLVHSQFNNSFFYPWVIGWMALLGGIVLQGQRNNK